MTDIVVTERHPKLCAESPQRLVVQPESKLDQEISKKLCLGEEDLTSAAHGTTFDPKPVHADIGNSETQENLEQNNKECSSLEDEHTQM